MNIHALSKQLLALQQEVNERHFRRALSLARTVPRDEFAATLWQTAPHPVAGAVSIDLDVLTDQELQLLSQWRG
jgi:hypothetical protein